MDEYQALLTRHQALQAQRERQPGGIKLEVVQDLMNDIQKAGRVISDPEQRDALNEVLLYWADFVQARTGEQSTARMERYAYGLDEEVETGRRPPLLLLVLGGVVGIILVAAGVAFTLVSNREPRDAPTVPVIAETEELTEMVTEVEAPPLPTPDVPLSTETPVLLPTSTEPPPPPATLTVAPPEVLTPAIPTDESGDVTPLAGGNPIAAPPAGMDISSCNVASTTLVQRDLPLPLAVPQTGEGEQLVLWLTLQEPVPEARVLTYHYLVALDVDGDPNTGRPTGAGYINPELGTEVGAGVFLYPDGELDPYLFIWDPAQGDWAAGDRVPEIAQATLDDTRENVALSFPLEELASLVEEISGTTFNRDDLRGRLGVITTSATEAPLVDFCPDLPE
ncbi:MAG: hypothetical protein ACP5GX_04835 [Anaerolineae bacterium]